MKKTHRTHFAQKLILYLLSVFGLIFCAVILCIFLCSQAYFQKNITRQAEQVSDNLSRIFNRKLSSIEKIPQNVFKFLPHSEKTDLASLPAHLLINFPVLEECEVFYDTLIYSSQRSLFSPFQDPVPMGTPRSSFRHKPDTTSLFRRNDRKGFWFLEKKTRDTLYMCYCEPFPADGSLRQGLLNLKIHIHHLTDFFKDIRFFKTGFPFIADSQGAFVAPPPSPRFQDFPFLPSSAIPSLQQGNKGHSVIKSNGELYYLYTTSIPSTSLRMGIICPYREIRLSSRHFFIFLWLASLSSFLFICWMIIRIVRRHTTPLQIFTSNIKKIAGGALYNELPNISSNDEIKELYDAFRYMQNHLLQYNEELKKTTIEKEKILSEIKLAHKIQSKFLPQITGLPSHLEIWGQLKQCKTIGGDLYDYFLIGHRLYFLLGDVSGKGIPAALYMVSIVKLFRYVARRYTSTAEICNIMNNFIYDDSDDGMYITLFAGILDIQTGILSFTNAGHPEPIVVHENHEIGFLHRYPDVPVGILKDYHYHQYTYTLHKNYRLLLYTDGITDAENEKGQFYGKERLILCIRQTVEKSPKELVKNILRELQNHIGKAVQSDDFTLLSILYKGIP